MHTSLIMVALMVPAQSPASTTTLKWQDSYGTARQMGRQESKPLAVFIGNGPTGWKRVAEQGDLSDKARRVLAEGYVCLYIDRTQPGGEQWAETFQVPSGPGLVLSSRDGEGQAFFHTGKLSAGDLEDRLARYASAETITRTEMLVDPRVSFAYNPTSSGSPAPSGYTPAPVQQYSAPSFGGGGFGGSFGGFGGGRASGGC